MAKTKSEIPDLDNESRITLGLLNMVQDNSRASQRSMASDLGIALGLANAYLKRCVKKGLVKVRQAPANRYAYYLTPRGFAEKSRLTTEFLSESFNLFRHARAEGVEMLALCQNRGWTRVALYGIGDLAEIMTLAARDFPVQLIAVIGQSTDGAKFAGLPVIAGIPDRDDVDAIIICDITEPQEGYDKMCAGFPADHILAPHFLHVVLDHGMETGGSS